MKSTKFIFVLLLFVFLIFVSSLTIFAVSEELPFVDLTEDWYCEDIDFVWQNGYMQGVSDDMFMPSAPATRAQIVSILSRIDGISEEVETGDLPFVDVNGDEWYYGAVLWGKSTGIIVGYGDGTFRPESPVTRQEFAAFIDRFLKYSHRYSAEAPLVDSFEDENEIAEWAKANVETLRKLGIVMGDESGCFNPASNITRSETAVMINRFIDSTSDPMYEKINQIYELCEGDGKRVRIYLNYRDRITDNGTSKSLSAQLLPQLGLDPEIYEMVFDMTSQAREALIFDTDCSITGGVVSNNNNEEKDENFGMARIKIRNTETGEETDVKALRLLVKRSLGDENADPEDFEPGLVSGAYEAMTEAALYSTGDLGRYAQFFDKAARGEPLTVMVIGGSITRGASAGDLHCYGKQVYNWINRICPESDVTFINAGIDGTGSDLGVIRFDATVLRHEPDLLIFEFGVNDSPDAKCQEGFETMVRRVLNMPNQPAVMILLVGVSNDTNCVFMKQVADKYGVALTDCRSAAKLGLENEWIYQIEVHYDGAHPREWFHTFMADMIVENIKSIIDRISTATEEELVISEIPDDRLTTAVYEDLKTDLPGSNKIVSNGFVLTDGIYKFGNGYKSSDPDAELTYEFDGKMLIIQYQGNEGFKYSIDGAPYIENFDDEWNIKINVSDDVEHHTVSIKPIGDGKTAVVCALSYK